MSSRAVEGTILDLIAPYADQLVTIRSVTPIATVDALYIPDDITTTTDSNGDFTVTLPVLDDPTRGVPYLLILPNNLNLPFVLSAGPGAANLSSLFVQALPLENPNTIQTAVDVHAAIDAAEGTAGHVDYADAAFAAAVAAHGGGGGGGGAPTTATYITQTPNPSLSAEQALSALGTGLLKNTTTTGVLSIATASDVPDLAQSQITGLVGDLAAKASVAALNAEAATRLADDSTLAGLITAEASTRSTADTTISGSLATHTALTTTAHGGIVADTDLRLTNARTPTAHASTHAAAGGDPITIAESQVTNLATDLAAKEVAANKGQANGYASLDGSAKVPTAQLPALALTDVYVVASQVAQLALTAEEGDVAIRTDLNKSYIHNGGTAGTMADWSELLTPTDAVLSVFGRTGAVAAATNDYTWAQINKAASDIADITTRAHSSLSGVGTNTHAQIDSHIADTISNPHAVTKAQVGLGSVDNTADTAKPVSTAQQAALDLKAPLASPTFTGTVAGITKTMVGLSNVDNTSDANKPISTATQTALDLKAPLASPALTGTPTVPTATAGTNTTQAASTAFATGGIATHEADTTAVHGIADTSVLLTTASSIPASQLTGTIAQARLGTGSGGAGTKALYDDQTYKTVTASVADGDKGDITVSSSGAVWDIDAGVIGTTELANDAVTYAKMQNVSATSRILGRVTAGAGDPEELTGAQARGVLGIETPTTSAVFYEDFVFGNPCATVNSGTGASVTIDASVLADSSGHPGIAIVTTGTTNTGRAALTTVTTGQTILLGAGAVTYETDVYLLDALSDGTDTYTNYIGLNDVSTGNGVDSVMFRYTHSTNSGKFECVTRSNSTETASDSGITVAATTWYKLGITVNAAASSVSFLVNGSVVATITTNIPTGSGRQTTPLIGIVKSAGTTARRILVDYIYCRFDLTSAR